jgi:hypothetical protein
VRFDFRSRPRWTLVGVAVPLYAGALVILRGRPTIRSDTGIFLSVAARLTHGARLYTGVWDNKPPLFYYMDALAFGVAGWRGPFLLDIVWVTIAAVSMWLLLTAARLPAWTCAAGLILYPLFLTGAWYSAGYSELSPLALAPAIGWLVLRGNPGVAGALVGALAFLRPDYAVVFAALLAAALVVRGSDRAGKATELRRLLAGFGAAAAVSALALAALGELTAYLDTMRGNVGYQNLALVQIGEPTGVPGHLKIVGAQLRADHPRAVLFVLTTAGLAVLLLLDVRRRSRAKTARSSREPTPALTVFLVLTAAATAVTLTLTALWSHNLQLLALPGTFATCFLGARLEAHLQPRRLRWAGVTGTAIVCLIAFGGLTVGSLGSPDTNHPLSTWSRTPRSASALALDQEAAKVRAAHAVVTYARLGQNNDDGHAAFIDGDLKLACPIFHQYPFSTNLDQTLSCIRRRLPQLLLIGAQFAAYHRPETRRWDAFVADSRKLLRAEYIRALLMPADGGDVEVWRRR